MLKKISLSGWLLLTAWTQLLAGGEVTVISSTNVTMSMYGMSWQSPQVLLRVKNMAYDKAVLAVFTDAQGKTSSIEASYIGPADEGYDLWQADGCISGEAAASFHVEYRVANQIFFDRDRSPDSPLKYGPIFYRGQNIQQVLGSNQFYGSSVTFTAAVRNIAYQKNVQVHYSFDEFRTQQTADMNFQPTYSYGYGSIVSPTADGFEMWSVSVADVPADQKLIHYYFTYEVEDKRFADTNFGHNYSMTRN